jgi:pimeloyl-ACP methyl ester carboxylesterase
MSSASRFKTPEGAAKFLAAYDATLALWPVTHEAMDVTTSFGTTHINVVGPPHLPPLVLIHGAQFSSPVWYPNIGPLSRHFRVYALDVIDQMGCSVPARRLKTPQDCSDWLTELLDALKLERATVIGHSQGGWQTINLALAASQRVERMVLLAPAPAFSPLRWQVFLRMIPTFIVPTRAIFYWGFQWATTVPLNPQQPNLLIEQFIIGVKSFKPQELSLGVTSVFTDAELRQISIPTLLLIGEHEVVYQPKQVLERAWRLIPHVEAELIAGGGHLFPVDQADATNARILEFLKASLHCTEQRFNT